MVGFDFEFLSFVSVEAPVGTDPETLVETALDLFVERIRNGDYEINCFQTLDLETGEVTPLGAKDVEINLQESER